MIFCSERSGNLILYPEGTRSSNGEMQAFKKGAGLFAVALGVPVVPAYIEGAHKILAKGQNPAAAGSRYCALRRADSGSHRIRPILCAGAGFETPRSNCWNIVSAG